MQLSPLPRTSDTLAVKTDLAKDNLCFKCGMRGYISREYP